MIAIQLLPPFMENERAQAGQVATVLLALNNSAMAIRRNSAAREQHNASIAELLGQLKPLLTEQMNATVILALWLLLSELAAELVQTTKANPQNN